MKMIRYTSFGSYFILLLLSLSVEALKSARIQRTICRTRIFNNLNNKDIANTIDSPKVFLEPLEGQAGVRHTNETTKITRDTTVSLKSDKISMQDIEKLVDEVDSIITQYEGKLLEYLPCAMHVDFAVYFRKVMVLACLALPTAFTLVLLGGTYIHSFDSGTVSFLSRYSSLICGFLSLLPTAFLTAWERRTGQIPVVTNLMEWRVEQQSLKCRRSLREEEANYMNVIVEGYQREDVDDLMYKLALWRLIANIDAEAMMLEMAQLHAKQDVAESEAQISSSPYSQLYSMVGDSGDLQRQKDANVVAAVQQILESSRQRGEPKEETLRQLKDIQSRLQKDRESK